MAFDVLSTIGAKERLDFSQNFQVVRPTVLDTIFKDTRSDYWKAEYYKLMSGAQLPDIAYVHALDTEAEIGQRIGFEKVELEKLFIKRKINQSESLQMAIEHGVPDNDALVKYVYDDATNLFEGVLARTKLMKAQAMCRGELKIAENGLNMKIDLHVPAGNKISNFGDWSDPDCDTILSDIQRAVDIASEAGHMVNAMLTTKKVVGYMMANKALQNAILGANNAKLLTKQEIANFIMQQFDMVINVCDEKYRYKDATGAFKQARYFDENTVSFYAADADGSFGAGLWGPTPEENEYRQFIEKTDNLYITMTMWATQDPVAKWTKASGLFVPVMPKTDGLVIATIPVG